MQLVNQAPHKHLLILDTNVCINDIDLFEMKCPATSLIVILQVSAICTVDYTNIRRNPCPPCLCTDGVTGGAPH